MISLREVDVKVCLSIFCRLINDKMACFWLFLIYFRKQIIVQFLPRPKSVQTIKGEFYANGVTNALKHEKGVISMARTNEPDSATSEFFIVDEAAPHLDGQYAAFGRITEGFDVLEKISQTETETNDKGFSDAPVKPVVIKTIAINK